MRFRTAERYSEETGSTMEISAATQEPGQIETLPCLCVDLDGTLVQGDTLFESLIVLLRTEPWRIFALIFWVFRGKARFKQELGRLVTLQPKCLPYDPAMLAYLRS